MMLEGADSCCPPVAEPQPGAYAPPVATWDEVRRIALSLPDSGERFVHGSQGWHVHNKGFVWERPLRKADLLALGDAAPTGPILGARVEHLVAKDALVGDAPEIYFTTPSLRWPRCRARPAGADPARRAAGADRRRVAGARA